MTRKRQHTTTSPFGTAGRVSHNADPFYASRLYADQPQEQVLLPNLLQLLCVHFLMCSSKPSTVD